MNIVNGIITFLTALLLTNIFLPMLMNLISETNLMCNNYKGIKIPTAMGLAFVFAQVLTLGLIDMFIGYKDGFTNVYLLGFIFMGLLGFLDDSVGTDKYKGMKQHIGAFLKGELSTGNIKATLGLFISIYISSFFSRNIITLLLNGVLIALCSNLMNLFDLRPGRAGKTFILFSLPMLIFNKTNIYDHIILSLYGILIPYMILDLKAELMMGDTGSNVLGFTLGTYIIMNFSIKFKVVFLLFIIVLHIIAEKTSFSKIIEENKILNYIDMLGR